jgi:hypothetical protein
MARGDMKALVEGTTRRRLVDFALWHRINERKNEAGVGQQETVTGEMQHHSQDAKADLGQKQLVASQALGVSPLRSNLPGLFVGHPGFLLDGTQIMLDVRQNQHTQVHTR